MRRLFGYFPLALTVCVAASFLALVVGFAQEPNTSVGKITNSSGNVAAATATATIAAAGGQLNYVCGFIVTGTGATTAVAISPTLAGMSGGTMTFTMGIIAGVLLQQPTLIMNFEPCQPASAVNTAITLSVPSFGAGNTNASANIWGYRGSP